MAIRSGGEEEWNFLWEQYQNCDMESERTTILSALAYSKEIWLLNRFLEWTVDENSGIPREYSLMVFYSVAATEIGYYLAKSFLQNRMKNIYQ